VAGLRDYKGHTHLLRAVDRLRAQGRRLVVDLIGDGELREGLEAESRALGLADAVAFHGARPSAEVVTAMERADVFVLPSVITASGKMEGLPVALMEAMAREVPVVATAISAIPELVEDGVTGLLVPPEDPEALAAALARLADDPELRVRLGWAGGERSRAMHDIRRTTALLRGRILAVTGPTA
jgi:colanic acid/amylovoran biosynthesis glycosyltransferase